jgi:hypothetical protein
VGELARIARWYTALLGADGQAIANSELGGEGLRFEAGPHILEFLTPREAASPLVDWLRRFGPSPYSAVLKASRAKTLDPRYTHGANFVLR